MLRRLLAAVVTQAVRDAQRGDAEAACFLDSAGDDLAEALELHVNAFADWRACESVTGRGAQRAARGWTETPAERRRRYRERERAAKEAAKC